MAEQLKEFNFGRLRARTGSSYDQFLDGKIWKISSEDSPSGTADLRSMQSSIANIAKARNLKIRTNVITDDKGRDFLVLQAYEPEEE